MTDTGADQARPRRILVTGGAGFIGASVVRTLEARGDQVRVIDDGRAAGFSTLDGTAAEIIRDDLLAADLAAALEGVDGVVHLAAQTAIGASIADPLGDLRDNVDVTVRLLEAARHKGAPRFVFASSSAVLGPSGARAAHEDDLPRPAVPYGAAKAAAEAYLHAYHQTHGLVTTSIRFANVYGPFSRHKASVIPIFIRHALAGEPLVIYGDGDQTRDFVHVDDLVGLILAVLEAPAERVGGRIFHGASGHETSVTDIGELVLRAAGRDGPIRHEPARHGDIPRSRLDITAARQVLGYEPRITLEAGIASTFEWFAAAGTDSASTSPR